jgi:N-acetylglucosaminyl-diphospho-decaprenol L-rhamnosyltransferase
MAKARKLTRPLSEAGESQAESPAVPQLREVTNAPPQPVDVSILIVTWNSRRFIDRCLGALPAACDGFTYEVIVHDNASDDAPLQRADVNVILRSSQNDGFAIGTNRAFEASNGRYVFLLNPDCELVPGALALLRDFLDRNPAAAGAAPLLVDEHGQSQREFQLRRLPTLRTLASELLAFNKIFPANRLTAHYRYRDVELNEPARIEQPAAAALLLRRETFEEVGRFDEQFSPAWFEDVDFCRRLAANGKSIWVVPAARAKHYGGASLEHLTFARFADIWYGNMWRYAQKWFPAGERETLRWLVIAGMTLRLGAALLGIAHPEVGRRQALAAYAGVLKKAFHRWSA